MTGRITIRQVPEAGRAVLDALARDHFRELLPDGPPYHASALDRYWIEPGRHPYLIEENGMPIGFALVWNHGDGTHELTEFTIRPDRRHAGIGTQAALLIFEALSGDWVLGVAQGSPGGMGFWRQCLEGSEAVTDIAETPPRTARQLGSFTFRVARG